MRIALAQINTTVGGFEINSKKILDCCRSLPKTGPCLVVFPELSLFGYPAFDLLERESLVESQLHTLEALAKKLPENLAVLVGAVLPNPGLGKPYFNSAILLQKGKKHQIVPKTLLPAYDVFDEGRFFESGLAKKNFVKIFGKSVFITVCEDGWAFDPAVARQYAVNPFKKVVSSQKIDVVVNMSASPFSLEKPEKRIQAMQRLSKAARAPVVYVNAVGAQDELIFDGGSFVLDKDRRALQCCQFEEELAVWEPGSPALPSQDSSSDFELEIQTLASALSLGISDFVTKTGQSRVHLGLSGGVDSAVVACLAVQALGAESVTLIGMPGPFSAKQSLTLAKKLAKNLGCRFLTFPISEVYKSSKDQIDQTFGVKAFGLVHENLQARIRGLILMAYSNAHGSMLLTTGNKSEYATGYSTLYGDMCGGLAPIGDLLKGQVWALAAYFNRNGEVIPEDIIVRAPSAELRPNQTDQDTLPPYDELDQSVQGLIVNKAEARTSTDKWVLSALNRTEFKRWQAPPILRVSEHSFGRGRRMPISHKAKV